MEKRILTTIAMLIAGVHLASAAELKVMVKDRDTDTVRLSNVTVVVSNVTPVVIGDVMGVGTYVATNTTDEKGVVRFSPLQMNATYVILLSQEGYETRSTSNVVDRENDVVSIRLSKKRFNLRLPIGEAIENAIEAIKGGKSIRLPDGTEKRTWGLSRITIPLSAGVEKGIDRIVGLLMKIPPIVFIIVLAVLIFFAAGWKIALFSFLGLLLIWNMELWKAMLNTITLVVISTALSIVIGLPLGILAAIDKRFYRVIVPILDFMQTMPAFVYLIPAVPFFGITPVSAIFAIVIFSIPPAIRLTALGILQVPEDLIEAANAFGSTKAQKLTKLQLPIALPTIMAGVNQSIMLALSMVVIASMIGAKGLGVDVLRAIQKLELGKGFEAGLAVVIIAMILDRVTQQFAKKS